MRNPPDREREAAGVAVEALRRQKAEDGDRLAIDAVLKTEEGRRVWGLLFRFCGYAESAVVLNGAGVQRDDMRLYLESRRSVYVQLRKMASPAVLHPVEARIEEAIAAAQPTIQEAQ